ncbi:hypothetical protein GALL_477800 [mine drainage metagenome]|uniref:Uncharacterized protein n=1 Tax=mine drainage metagenome TaxID=410659 RepID=A0A1J5PSN1_9ZZZZ
MKLKAKFARHDFWIFRTGHDEGCDTKRLWIYAKNELGHGRISGESNFIHVVRVDSSCLAYLFRQFGKSLLS